MNFNKNIFFSCCFLCSFAGHRLRVKLKELGKEYDPIDAVYVLAKDGIEDTIVKFFGVTGNSQIEYNLTSDTFTLRNSSGVDVGVAVNKQSNVLGTMDSWSLKTKKDGSEMTVKKLKFSNVSESVTKPKAWIKWYHESALRYNSNIPIGSFE